MRVVRSSSTTSAFMSAPPSRDIAVSARPAMDLPFCHWPGTCPSRQRPHRIVAVTANAMSGDRERRLRYGMDDYVSKPVELDELAQILAKWARRPVCRWQGGS